MKNPLDVYSWGDSPSPVTTELPALRIELPSNPRGLVSAHAVRYAEQESGFESDVHFDVTVNGVHYGTFVYGPDGWRWS